MAAEKKAETTDWYLKAFGFIALALGTGYILSKWSQNKKNNNVMNSLTAKAELEKIINPEPIVDSNVQVTVEPSDKVMSGAMRSSAFGEKEDVAVPTNIKVAAPAKAVAQNDVGEIPLNAIVGKDDTVKDFTVGDVIYSAGSQDAKIARTVSAGNFSFSDKNGTPLGTIKANHQQKLGVVMVKEPNGLYFKVSPDYKKIAFIAYHKIYKLG